MMLLTFDFRHRHICNGKILILPLSVYITKVKSREFIRITYSCRKVTLHLNTCCETTFVIIQLQVVVGSEISFRSNRLSDVIIVIHIGVSLETSCKIALILCRDG